MMMMTETVLSVMSAVLVLVLITVVLVVMDDMLLEVVILVDSPRQGRYLSRSQYLQAFKELCGVTNRRHNQQKQ